MSYGELVKTEHIQYTKQNIAMKLKRYLRFHHLLAYTHSPDMRYDTFEEIRPLIGHSTHQQTAIRPTVDRQPTKTESLLTTEPFYKSTRSC